MYVLCIYNLFRIKEYNVTDHKHELYITVFKAIISIDFLSGIKQTKIKQNVEQLFNCLY